MKSGLMNFIPRISREEAVVCVCFGLVNVLAAAVNEFGGTLLPRVDLFNPEMLTTLDTVAGGTCVFENSFAVGECTRISRVNYDYARYFDFLELRCHVISTVHSHRYSQRLYFDLSVERTFGMRSDLKLWKSRLRDRRIGIR